MKNKDKINKLENLRQKYLILREFVLYYHDVLEQNKIKEEENIKVKKLVLTKSFYGKNLIVG